MCYGVRLYVFTMKNSFKRLIEKHVLNVSSFGEFRKLLNRIKGITDPKEEKELLSAARSAASESAEDADYSEAFDEVYNDLMSDFGQEESPLPKIPKAPQKKKFVWYKAAAVIVLAIAATWILYPSATGPTETSTSMLVYETRAGQKSTITLSDGSVVRLNSGSRLTYPKVFSGNSREVSLEGEAFFEVIRNERKPFIISTSGVVTEVLGTSFNIRAFPEEDVQVTVATGKVRVAAEEGSGVLLTPSEQAVFDTRLGTLEKKAVELDRYLAWKEGRLRFDDARLSDVITALERWYGTTITLQNKAMGNCLIAAQFQNKNLAEVLKVIQLSMVDFQYEFRENGGEISVAIDGNEGCPQ